MLKDRYLADLPIVVAAIDPCFSCTDRMIALRDRGTGQGESLTWGALRDYSIDWHRRHGIDFTDLNRNFTIPERG
jgi:NADH-quinone oxidoreductase subunit D